MTAGRIPLFLKSTYGRGICRRDWEDETGALRMYRGLQGFSAVDGAEGWTQDACNASD